MAEIDVAEALEQAGVTLRGLVSLLAESEGASPFGRAAAAVPAGVVSGEESAGSRQTNVVVVRADGSGAVSAATLTSEASVASGLPTVTRVDEVNGGQAGLLPLSIRGTEGVASLMGRDERRIPVGIDVGDSSVEAPRASERLLVDGGAALTALTAQSSDSWRGADVRPRTRRTRGVDEFGVLEIMGARGY